MAIRVYPLAQDQWDKVNGCAELFRHWDTSANKVEAEALVGALMASHCSGATTVADLGCGPGRYVPVCFEHLDTLRRYTGYDSSDGMIAKAEQDYGDRVGVKFAKANIFDRAPYTKRWRPDVLLSIDTSRHYKDPLGLLDVIVDRWPARYYLFSVLYGKPAELMNGRVVATADMEARLPQMGRVIAWQDIKLDENMSVRYVVIEGE